MNDNLSMNNTLVNIKEGFNRGNMFDNLFWSYKYIADIKTNDPRSKLMMDIQMIYGALDYSINKKRNNIISFSF